MISCERESETAAPYCHAEATEEERELKWLFSLTEQFKLLLITIRNESSDYTINLYCQNL